MQPGKLDMYKEGNDGKNRKGAKQNINSSVTLPSVALYWGMLKETGIWPQEQTIRYHR